MHRLTYLKFIEEHAKCALTSTQHGEAKPSPGIWTLVADRHSTHLSIGKSRRISTKSFVNLKTNAGLIS